MSVVIIGGRRSSLSEMALHFHLAQPPAALVVGLKEEKPQRSREEIYAELRARLDELAVESKYDRLLSASGKTGSKRGQRRARFR